MKIYFGFTVAGDRSSVVAATKIVELLVELGHEVLTRHLIREDAWQADRSISLQEVYQRDMTWLKQCDLFVAEVSGSSFGSGFETGYLLGATTKKVTLFYRRDVEKKISLMITGIMHPNCSLVPYSHVDEVEDWIKGNLVQRAVKLRDNERMNLFLRRSLIGLLAGAAASVALAPTLGHPLLSIVWGMAVGTAYSASLHPTRHAYVDNLMTGAALGIPLWGLISVIAMPLLSGQMPEWSAEQMRMHFPTLVGWVLYGTLLGLFTQGLTDITETVLGLEVSGASPPQEKKRIVILGGGFAGMRTAECLEKQLQDDSAVSITLVSDTNALLFTPMLAEVAGSSLEPSHISTPLRSSLHRTEFIRGRADKIDLEQRRVILEGEHNSDGSKPPREIPYDQLVLALGSVSNYLGMVNIERLAFNFKSLLDAIRIRNHVIEMFERADREPNPLFEAIFSPL